MKLLAALAVLLLAPATALAGVNAGTETTAGGSVSATLAWDAGDAGPQNVKLAITRAGATAFDRLVPEICGAACDEVPSRSEDFSVADLEGDGDPEVVFSGLDGRECCGLMDVFYFDGTSYRQFRRDFRDSFSTVGDLDHDGRAEVIGRDTRFDRFFEKDGSYFLPLAIYEFTRRNGGAPELRSVTRRFRGPLLNDAGIDRLYAHIITKPTESDTRGVVGSYVADEFLLGRGAVGLKFFDRQAKRGILGAPRAARAFRRQLLARLHRYGYR